MNNIQAYIVSGTKQPILSAHTNYDWGLGNSGAL